MPCGVQGPVEKRHRMIYKKVGEYRPVGHELTWAAKKPGEMER